MILGHGGPRPWRPECKKEKICLLKDLSVYRNKTNLSWNLVLLVFVGSSRGNNFKLDF